MLHLGKMKWSAPGALAAPAFLRPAARSEGSPDVAEDRAELGAARRLLGHSESECECPHFFSTVRTSDSRQLDGSPESRISCMIPWTMTASYSPRSMQARAWLQGDSDLDLCCSHNLHYGSVDHGGGGQGPFLCTSERQPRGLLEAQQLWPARGFWQYDERLVCRQADGAHAAARGARRR